MKDAGPEREVQNKEGIRIAPIAGGFAPADTHLGSTVTGWLHTGDTAVSAVGVVPAPGRDGMLDDEFDPDLSSRIEEALVGDGRIDSSRIAIAADEGTVELSGSVGTEREKREAEDVCARVPGVRNVVNRLEVSSPQAR